MRDYGFSRQAKHVVVLDCDGTVIKPSIVQALIDAGLIVRSSSLARTNELIDRGIRGALTKKDEIYWLEESMNSIIKARLRPSQVFSVLKNIELRPGVIDCLTMLSMANVPVAMISYGVSEFVSMLVPEDYCSAVFGVALILDDGINTDKQIVNNFPARDCRLIVNWDRTSMVLPSTKGDCSRKFADLRGVPYENILAVGDSGSDRNLGFLKENRLGIAEDKAHADKIRKFMGEVVISKDFYPVMSWLERKIKGGVQ